jgi:hypothetical protein
MGAYIRYGLCVVPLLLSTATLGQSLVVGALPPNPSTELDATSGDLTAIGYASPAPGAGTLTDAVFYWSASPCLRAAKIKFFRTMWVGEGRQAPVQVVVAERGPFDVTAARQSVAFSPPVAVESGDRIGIARVASCGNPMAGSAEIGGVTVLFGDVSGIIAPGSYQGTFYPNASLAAEAIGVLNAPPSSPEPAAIVPVIGSTPGAVGSAFFRSSVQLHNAQTTPIAGRLVYHPQGLSGTSTDPSLFYSLQPGETVSIPDLLPAMGLSGLGSLDFVPDSGVPPPLGLVRVFNDSGAAGTTGFTQDALPAGDALGVGQRAILISPSDPDLFRFNIGVRTLAEGATLAVTVRSAAGQVRRTLMRSYPPRYMEQKTASEFSNPTDPLSPAGPNEAFAIEVTAGRAVIYGAIVDNRTNDPSLQLAKKVP